MIVVIADDLTGAAELGGLALRYNMVVEITTQVNIASKADLLIVATDTRSMLQAEAEKIIAKVCGELKKLKPALIFKKIDSVLRGHVLAEIYVQQKAFNLSRALIVGGNPGLGRTIVDGTYLLGGSPVHLSSFSKDPDFPVRSSNVREMLHPEGGDIAVLKPHEPLPETGIVVAEVRNGADIAAWCNKIDRTILIAGAAEFFTAILRHFNKRSAPQETKRAVLQLPALMICGSAFNKSEEFISRMANEGFPVTYLPDDTLDADWVADTVRLLKGFGTAIIAINPAMREKPANPLALRARMAEAAALIAADVEINECLIEGGATAASVMKALDIDTLYPLQELAPGVIRMGVKGKKDLHVTLKPGSYDWPASILYAEEAVGKYEVDCIKIN